MVRSCSLALSLLLSAAAFAAEPPSPASTPQQRATERALERWREQRYGLFIHWGPVSLTGNEIGWSRGGTTPGMIPIEEYDALYQRFNPVLFDADEWVQTARDAGMKYLVITAKHADGFCLWPSQFTDYNISHTPFRRDVLKELAAACKRQGVQFSVYYCLTDWWHPDYPLGSPGGRSKKPNPDMPRYVEYVKNQVRELILDYGPLGELWFDIGDGAVWTPEDRHFGEEIFDYVKSLQPSLLVNDRCKAAHGSGDFSTLGTEGQIGGFNRVRPWETAMVINGHWAWDRWGIEHCMTREEIVHWLLRVAGNDGNFLLNVGPRGDGRIEPLQVQRLKEAGDWLRVYGQGVYGTRGGPYKAGRWGASTCKGDRIYLYVIEWPGEGSLRLPVLPAKLLGYRAVTPGKAKVRQGDEALLISCPPEERDAVATVLELTVEGQAFDIPPLTVPSFTQLQLPARSAAVAESLKRGRIALWHLDEGTGTEAADSGPQHLTLTVTGEATWEAGKFGQALVSPKQRWVALANPARLPLPGGLSLAAWVRLADQGTASLTKGGASVGITPGALAFALHDAEGRQYYYPAPHAGLLLTTDAWHHVAASWDGTTMRLYVDGEEAGTGLKAPIALKEADGPFRFTLLLGALGEVSVYDRALAAEEVVALATAPRAEE